MTENFNKDRVTVLIDGNSVIYRAFYNVPPLTAGGVPTGVIHVFLSVLEKLRKNPEISDIIIIFDAKGKNRRHEMFESYKATRQAMPEDLIVQLNILKEMLPYTGYPIYCVEGYEADDVINTLSQTIDNRVWIVTKDKDLHQLVNDKVQIYDYQKDEVIDREKVYEKFGLYPESIPDMLALMGDTSDNIPGIAGIGPKTAKTLLDDYKNLDNIFANVENLKGKTKEKIMQGRESAYLSRELVKLFFIDNMTPSHIERDEEKLKYLQALRYEVFSLKQQLGKDIAESIPYDDYLYKKTSAKKFNALAQSYNDASKKSGLFAGLGIGVVDIYTSGNVDNEFVITRITPIIYNLNGGYQKFFNHYMGVRLYGGISTSLFSDVQRYNINNGEYQMVPNPYNAGGNIQSFYALGTISADFLFEFPLTNTFRHYIGGFAGINIGFMYYRPYATHPQKGSYYPASYIWNYNLQVDYSFNLGMNFTVFDIHRIEFHLSIPFSYLSLPGLAESANIMETVPAQFWRSAIFSLNYKMIIHFKKK